MTNPLPKFAVGDYVMVIYGIEEDCTGTVLNEGKDCNRIIYRVLLDEDPMLPKDPEDREHWYGRDDMVHWERRIADPRQEEGGDE